MDDERERSCIAWIRALRRERRHLRTRLVSAQIRHLDETIKTIRARRDDLVREAIDAAHSRNAVGEAATTIPAFVARILGHSS
jgi:hypothetical protein